MPRVAVCIENAGIASATSSAAGEARRSSSGRRSDAVDDAPQTRDRRDRCAPHAPADERDAAAVDAVAEQGQRGRDGTVIEPSIATATTSIEPMPNDENVRVAREEHARHRGDHGEARDEHRAAGGGGGDLERLRG